MLVAEPRALLAKLNHVTRRALERGAGLCVQSGHHEVTPEHVLLALLEDAESDLVAVFGALGAELEPARSALHRALGEMRGGNPGRPVFSPVLLEWLQDAWTLASLEHGAQRLRSAMLLTRLVESRARYLATSVSALEAVPREGARVLDLASGSAEARDEERAASVASAGGAPRASSGGEGDGALARFTSDLTARAKKGGLDPVFGRDAEVRQVIDVLSRRRKNNPILVGDPGVGKTALVEGLALRIAAGEVPEVLAGVRLLVLDLAALQAGASMRGEFENRLKSVIGEVQASPTPIVLFIDEAHTLIGAGGAQGGGDAANLLKPALARGELRTIAATTWAEYKRYFEKDAALERRFQPVKVEEPSIETAIEMMRGLARKLEEAHGVIIQDAAVRAAVTLSSRYITGRQLPDKAVDLLDTASARVRIARAAPPAPLDDVRGRLAANARELDAYARDEAAGHPVDEELRAKVSVAREELTARQRELTARLEEQRAMVARVDEFRGRLAGGEAAARDGLRAELDRLRAIPAEGRLVHADVDDALVASVVASWTGVPVGRMVQDELAAVLGLEDRLRVRVRGQDAALGVIARELRAARAGLKPPSAPLGVFLLVGPSGVGKTETALALADALFGGERSMVTINMSEFQERHTTSRLVGSPPGYVGYGEGGVLTEAVRQRPYTVVLLDEVEKADRDVMNLFYQVFDKGTLADGEGRVIDFANTVIVMTSNLATDLVTRAADPGSPVPPLDELVALVKPTISAHFKPALLARMTVVPYVPIRPEALVEIVRLKVGALTSRAREAHGAEVVVDPRVLEAIAARCREVESGARNVDHVLRGAVMPELSRALLESMAAGEPVTRLALGLGPGGAFECKAISPGAAPPR